MSELTLFLIRVAYLAILWIFVLSAISVIRSDMFGARVPEAARGGGGGGKAPKPPKQPKPGKRRTVPTHVLVTEGSTVGELAELAAGPVLIGRGSEADVRINDPGVSRRHVEFSVAPSGGAGLDVAVRDLGSTNGMLVDGHKMARASLRDGSTVRIGNTTMALRLTSTNGGADV